MEKVASGASAAGVLIIINSLIIICSLDAFFNIKGVFILFSIEFVANHALLEALNLSRITHFWCKFLCPKKAAGVNVLPYSNSDGKSPKRKTTHNHNFCQTELE